jgi:phosphoadenosine phosphosulfate reductase
MKKIKIPNIKDPQKILIWADKTFKDKIALSTSFGAEGVVIIDMWVKINKKPRIFFIDTGRLPCETYDTLERIKNRYNINIKTLFPERAEVEKMVDKFGPNLFYKSVKLRKMCCKVRKVNPLNRGLKGLEAWVTGLRREQSVARLGVCPIETDKNHGGIVKINPLALWSWNDVWQYIKDNGIPYSKLYDQKFFSIGCAPCSRPTGPDEDHRNGRWWWELPKNRECGLHTTPQEKEE